MIEKILSILLDEDKAKGIHYLFSCLLYTSDAADE